MCAGNYAPGLSYSCRSCIGNDRTIALGLSSVFFVLAGLVIFIAVADLLRTVDEAAGEKETLQPFGSWSFVSRVAGVMPWSAIKIVVVVWQIVSQVSTRGRYDVAAGNSCYVVTPLTVEHFDSRRAAT